MTCDKSEPGWINRELDQVKKEVDSWPEWLRREAGIRPREKVVEKLDWHPVRVTEGSAWRDGSCTACGTHMTDEVLVIKLGQTEVRLCTLCALELSRQFSKLPTYKKTVGILIKARVTGKLPGDI